MFTQIQQIREHLWVGCACQEELTAMIAVDQFAMTAVENGRREEAIEALNIIAVSGMGMDPDVNEENLDEIINELKTIDINSF